MPLALAVLMVVLPLFGDKLATLTALARGRPGFGHCLAHGPVRRKRSTTHATSALAVPSWLFSLDTYVNEGAPGNYTLLRHIHVVGHRFVQHSSNVQTTMITALFPSRFRE
jgi:hypothetical protein